MRKPLAVIFLVLFVDIVAFSMLLPLVGLYGRHYEATGFRLAVLGAAFSVMQFLFAPFWGARSDAVGRRPVLLTTIAGGTIALLVFGLAKSYELLLAARALSGVFAANISVAQAYVADVSTKENRAKGMGMVGAAIGLGFVFGPPIGGLAAFKIGLGAPGFIAAGLSLLNLVLAYHLLEEPPRPERSEALPQRRRARFSGEAMRLVRENRALRLLTAVSFVATFAFCHMEQSFSLFLQNRFGFETAEAGYEAGLIMMWMGLCGALVQGGFIRRLVPRFGEVPLLYVGSLVLAAGMLLFPLGTALTWFYGIGTLVAIGAGISNPSLYSLLSRSAAEDEQGLALGVAQGFTSLARASGPLLALTLFTVGESLPLVLAGALYILVAVLVARGRSDALDQVAMTRSNEQPAIA